jgi:uncharacterized protein YqeY
MTTPTETVERDLRSALKAGEKERLGTLRMLLTEVKNERIRSGAEVGEEAFAGLVRKAIKQRQDAAEQFRAGHREELAAKEEREAEILSGYLPQQASEDEIRAAVETFVAAEGLSGPQAIGPVMREMLGRFGARADGGTINRVARQVLAGPGG